MSGGEAVTLEKLIAPLSVEVFLREFWEQRPLLQQPATGRSFDDLFSVEAAEQIVDRYDPRAANIRLVRDGRIVPQGAPGSGANDDRPPQEQIREAYRQGATIILMGVQFFWPAVGQLSRHLEELLGHPIKVNAYWSPPNAQEGEAHQGLAVHYDTHDVIALQISGQKLWRIYDAPFPLPLSDQVHTKTGARAGECLHEATLRPGDLVYLPRGQFHEARTSGQHSLHLTIGIMVRRWLDALVAAVQALGDDVRFRKALPLQALEDGGSTSFEAEFEEIRRLALQGVSARQAAARLRGEVKGDPPA